jgi:hypothetical protein
MSERKESIVDASVPNAGRIYDHILGGHHNFEVDRQAAEQLLKLMPYLPKAMRLQRWCLQDVARELTEVRGYDAIIDFASGLPTVDHLHTAVKPGTTVIYSDYDPVVVEYAHEILSDTPNVYFFEADARQPEELLERPQVQDILGGRRDVALVYWGISTFLKDEEIAHAARVLYEWSGDNSCWAFNAQAGGDPNDPTLIKLTKIYERTGTPLLIHSLEKIQEALKPWRAGEEGFVSVLEWHGFDQSEMSAEDRRALGASGGGYGAYLVK